jgi:hypothetical protein
MYNKLLKSGTTYAMMLGVILIFIFGAGIFAGGTKVNEAGVEVVEVGIGLQITIALALIALIAMIVGIVLDIAQAGKKGIKSMIRICSFSWFVFHTSGICYHRKRW